MQLRRLTIVVTSLALALTTFLGTTSSATPEAKPGKDKGTFDKPWSGFEIKKTGKAAGGWIGGRKYRGTPVYRLDPGARTKPGGFKKAHVVDRLTSPGKKKGASARNSARAAWILSKYGSYRYDVQNAAVDAAVLSLLSGNAYKLGKKLGKRRLKQTGERKAVVKFARIMLSDSKKYAGPYAVSLAQTSDAIAGVSAALDIGVTAITTGFPLRNVPVTVTYEGGAVSAGETDDAGHVALTIPTPAAGLRPITIKVGKAPQSRLVVRSPRDHQGSRIAVAGRKRSIMVNTSVAVKTQPSVTIAPKPTAMLTGAVATGTFTLANADSTAARTAGVNLWGPFASSSAPVCTGTGKLFASGTVPVAASGAYALPSFKPTSSIGTVSYFWQVAVPGDATNLPTAACAGKITVTR